jgi:outer membrane receptor protein involved in Fe transport
MVCSSIAQASAQTAPTATSAVITGTITSAAGSPVGGATVNATGPSKASTTTKSDGSFSLTVPAGVYDISVTRGGFQPASVTGVTIVPGSTQPLRVTLTETSFSSLQTIGTTTTTASGRSTINTGPAATTVLSADQFAQSGNPQINDVLQQVPNLVVQHLATALDTSIVVGGLQPYETQVLIDGHPLALGQYGVWLSEYFPSWMIGSAQVESGPGNTTPFANLAVGGTVNLSTPSFTNKTSLTVNAGTDSYSSLFADLLYRGKWGNLSYVLGAGTSWYNSPYSGKNECDLYISDPTTVANSPGFAGIVPFCGTVGGSFIQRGQLYKVKYDFSPATSLQLSFVGSYGGYNPQGYFSGIAEGPATVEECIPGTLQCTAPNLQYLVGKTIANSLFWYPGTIITSQQQMYSAEFRTTIGNDTLLERPYIATIEPDTYNGQDEGTYPAFFAPSANMGYPACTTLNPTATCYPGPQSIPPGTQIPATGLTNPNAFEAPNSFCPTGTIYSFYQINSPNNTITTIGGQGKCYQYPYSTFEHDTLYGNTLTYIHPWADNEISFTYDFHGGSAYAFANAPTDFQVPEGSATRFSTFSLTGDLHPIDKLTVDFGLYNTLWTVNGEQPIVSNGNAVEGPLQRSVSRFDPHFAFVYRPKNDTSIRAAYGTSETFPFIGDLTGPAAVQGPSPPQFLAGIVSEKNANLDPERSIAYSLGADHRFKGGSVLSLDLVYTVIHDVIQDIETTELVTYDGTPNLGLGIFAPYNVAQLQSKVATIKYGYAPRTGLGYSISAAADSSILTGIPIDAFGAYPGLPANNVQICGIGADTPGITTCIPYLKGYGQLTYDWKKGGHASIGVDYEGKNNAYYQPPFAIVDLSYSHPVGKFADLQFSVQNLLNTDTGENVPAANLGVPVTGDYAAANGTIQQGSFSTFLLPAAPQLLRLELTLHS